MVASVLGIAGSGCFSGSDDPEEGFVSLGCAAVSNWYGDLGFFCLWDNWESIISGRQWKIFEKI